MTQEILRGRVRNSGTGWVSDHWAQIVQAHAEELPDIRMFYTGSFNIDLTAPAIWRPPNESFFYARARERGLWLEKSLLPDEARGRGSEFLACGNFIHPQIRVVRLNDHAIDGRLYFAGIERDRWRQRESPWPLSRLYTGIEIIATQRLRTLLGLGPDAGGHDLEVGLEVDLE